MKKTKRLLSILVALCLAAGIASAAGIAAQAADPAGYVAVSVDANVLGVGYLYEPGMVPFYAGESVADVTRRFAGEENVLGQDSALYGYYIEGFKLQRDISVTFAGLPGPIHDEIDLWFDGDLDPGASHAGEFLKGDDYCETFYAGWTFSVDDAFPSVGAGSLPPQDGEVIRWQFSMFMGADLGNDYGPPYGFGYNIVEPEDRTALTLAVAQINSAADKAMLLGDTAVKAAYDAAYVALEDLLADASDIASALASLNSALAALAAARLAQAKTDAKAALDSYKDSADYRDAQKTELAGAIAAGKAAIDAAADIAGVNAALSGAKTAMDAVKTDAQLTAEEPWWMSLRPAVQFILRYLFFGWIWMVPARADWFCYYILFCWVKNFLN